MTDKILTVSRPKVMQSAAGYYVGCSCEVKYDDGSIHEEPYCRDSGYFETKEKASLYLIYILDDADSRSKFLIEANKSLN